MSFIYHTRSLRLKYKKPFINLPLINFLTYFLNNFLKSTIGSKQNIERKNCICVKRERRYYS